MNKVILMGRLTRDPEVRYGGADGQMAIARYTLAIDRRQRDAAGNQQADFIPCTAFGKGAEFAEKYFRQGQRVLITGHIQTGSYTNRDGVKVYTTTVITEEQEFADSRKDGGADPGQQSGNQRGSGRQEDTGFINVPQGADETGLPFA